ncbi:hypothetical protein SB751_34440, partial [Cupriavidus sp. SIMBA_020]|uniref:hypothetical protein n=1 Tax=Cupriavidus sp. SIMBA_020 TaxID=3085766 RepID=UPI00397B860F
RSADHARQGGDVGDGLSVSGAGFCAASCCAWGVVARGASACGCGCMCRVYRVACAARRLARA